MATLTQPQLEELSTLAQRANANPNNAAMRESYYQQLADDGENYGAIAKGVVQGTSLAGYVADQFLKDQAESVYGKTLSDDDMQNISLRLMNADLATRQSSGGQPLSGETVQSYHTNVFDQVGLGPDACTATEPMSLMGDTAWALMNGDVFDQADVYVKVAGNYALGEL